MTPPEIRVRVIDDDSTIIHLLTIILEFEDIVPVITGSDFDRLLEAKAWHNIDAALVDMNLRSAVTGADLLSYLEDNHPDVRRVAFTGMDLKADELGTLAHAVITKPADAQQIAEALRG